MTRFPIPLGLALLLSACGQAGEVKQSSSDLRTMDVAEMAPPAQSGPGAPVTVAAPQIAYVHSYTFRLAPDAVGSIQERHLALCDRLGPARCRVIEMKRGASTGDYVNGSLKLQVAAPIARRFGNQLVATAAQAGAETLERGIAAEDLSKQIVDTDARIRIKEALVGRLTTLLQTRSGNIAQAVEAERAINAAQEELEAARGWLAEMRGRVAMSTFEIGYQSGTPLAGGFSEPIRDSLASVGELFGRSLGLIIYLAAALLPWLLLALALFFAIRAARRRWTARSDAAATTAPAEE